VDLAIAASDKVLELLYDRREGFFELRELASSCNLSAKRLAGALADLQNCQYELEFSPAHGVRLIRPVKLNAHLIERKLSALRVGRSVICFDEVDSTNDVAWDSARQAGTDGLAVLVEFQRRGRGRLGRKWLSPPGKNVLMSVLLVDNTHLLAHDALTIAAGLAVAEGIEASCGAACELKWPNDVLIDGAKTAGVLVETRSAAGCRHLVIGIGINVNAVPPAEEIDVRATCLADHQGQQLERIETVRSVLRRLDEWVCLVERRKLSELHSAWLARCGMLNQRVAVLAGGDRYEGRVLDISPLEGLILCSDDGRTLHFPAESTTLL
jgi:BirA family biotin operon repressor/biotin-[acetyl-CoA-carboxylase] ligase